MIRLDLSEFSFRRFAIVLAIELLVAVAVVLTSLWYHDAL